MSTNVRQEAKRFVELLTDSADEYDRTGDYSAFDRRQRDIWDALLEESEAVRERVYFLLRRGVLP